MNAFRSTIEFYEIEDGNKLVLEFQNDHDEPEHLVTMNRNIALDLAHGIIELLGDY